jgi:hypothetical protein
MRERMTDEQVELNLRAVGDVLANISRVARGNGSFEMGDGGRDRLILSRLIGAAKGLARVAADMGRARSEEARLLKETAEQRETIKALAEALEANGLTVSAVIASLTSCALGGAGKKDRAKIDNSIDALRQVRTEQDCALRLAGRLP